VRDEGPATAATDSKTSACQVVEHSLGCGATDAVLAPEVLLGR
jgi:hypothetical protein